MMRLRHVPTRRGGMPTTPAAEQPHGEAPPPARWLRSPATLLTAIVCAAVLAPAISLSPSAPDIRIEQLLALPALLIMLAAYRRRDLDLRPGPIDVAFLGLAAASLLSVLYAPLVLKEAFSPRDGYEIVKLALYWVLFRFGLYAGRAPGAVRGTVIALLVAGSLAALAGLAQYFDWLGFATATGGWWAPAHHLRALERDGRAFGTVGNPNYFGALMVLVAAAGLARRTAATRRGGALAAGAVAAGALGVVLSGSRGALAALAVAVSVMWMLALLARFPRGRLLAGTFLLLLALAASVLLVELFPRGRLDYVSRVTGAFSAAGDGDLALRLERWRGLVRSRPKPETGAGAVPGPATATTGQPSAGAPAHARDAQRKADVRRLAAAVMRYRQATGTLPPGPGLGGLVPVAIEALPADPADGSPYRYERTATGFSVAARLEDPADPDYPLFAAGEARNYIENGDLERAGGRRAAGFHALPGTAYRRAPEAALFGSSGIVFRGNPQHPQQRAAVYQQRYVARADGAPLTAAVWVKLPAPVHGELFLYTNLYYADGERQDPYARVAADSSRTGVWQRLSITITPERGRRVDFLGVYLLADGFSGEAWADGFELVDGGVPFSFMSLPEAEGSAALGLDVGAQFRRSPVFGAGPQKAADAGVVDNEYLLVLARYGLVGIIAYLALWTTVLVAAIRRVRPHPGGEAEGGAPALAMAGFVAGLLVFNLVAGSLYHLQLMGVFWPVAGLAVAPHQRTAREPLR